MPQDSTAQGATNATTGTGQLPTRAQAAPARNDDQEVRDALALALRKVSDFVRARPMAALGAVGVVAYFLGRSRPNGPPPPRRGWF